MMQIELCPICGKIPKISKDYDCEYSRFGARCIIQCKPFLRKHLRIIDVKASYDEAL